MTFAGIYKAYYLKWYLQVMLITFSLLKRFDVSDVFCYLSETYFDSGKLHHTYALELAIPEKAALSDLLSVLENMLISACQPHPANSWILHLLYLLSLLTPPSPPPHSPGPPTVFSWLWQNFASWLVFWYLGFSQTTSVRYSM